MALTHTAPGEIVDVRAPTGAGRTADSKTLIRIDHLEVFRYALPAGKVVDMHTAAGVMLLQCLEGEIEFTALGRTQTLRPGALVYLPDREPHALKALSDTQLLVTILLHRK
ncbi:MAG: cupin domain-containing protein [Gammaproteobacteria bacterium]|nr:MAG: cupin domain-containing protein [Gammaproteobacteria bacterium]